MDLKIFFNFYEELCWDFDGDYIQSVDCFQYNDHFHNINPQSMSMEDASIFWYFFSVLKFSLYESFSFLVRFIPRFCWIFFFGGGGREIVNNHVSLISFSVFVVGI